jgi:predicted RNase H-like HicB family nuclease
VPHATAGVSLPEPNGGLVESATEDTVLVEYLNAAMEHAVYDKIEDEEPYYGEIPDLQGLWATGASLEECRRHLLRALEDWVFFSIYRGLPIPSVNGAAIELPHPVSAA